MRQELVTITTSYDADGLRWSSPPRAPFSKCCGGLKPPFLGYARSIGATCLAPKARGHFQPGATPQGWAGIIKRSAESAIHAPLAVVALIGISARLMNRAFSAHDYLP